MPIVLTHDDLANGLLGEYEALAQLAEGLDEAAWATPTRCTGWDVRDAIGHVAGLAADVVAGAPGGRTADEQAAATRVNTPSEVAAQLRASCAALRSLVEVLDTAAWEGPSGVPDLTLADGVEGLWFDAYMHGDDARAALCMEPDRGPSLTASVLHLARILTNRGWGPVTLTLDGLPALDIGAGGRKITGDPYQFVLVGSGRADAATLGLDARVNVYADQ